MCGIAGLYSFQRQTPYSEEQHALVRRMTDRMIHRGPDADGVWVDDQGRCALGHRRLSIIDTSDAGRQPMHWNNGEWSISFNGEIYNFNELRMALQAQGVVFHGRTDTEVLLAGLAVWGDNVFSRLDGMFAFAAFHRPSGEMILARDPFGEKPLYYFQTDTGGIAFASELQCLEIVPGFSPEVCPDALSELLMFQYIGAPRTIYRQVRKLPPGHFMRVKGSSVDIRRYFHFEPGAHGFSSESKEALADQLEDILVRSLQRRMISDVPLGAFLSGGVDSSTVCALARRKLGVPLKTFSIGFEGAEESEHELARAFSKHLGTEHYDQILMPSATDFLDHAGKLLDEPNADSSCLPTYLLSQFARQHVTVALSGDGGDELFGGYRRYIETLDEAAQNRGSRWSPGNAYYSGRILVFTPNDLGRLFGMLPQGAIDHRNALVKHIDSTQRDLLCLLRETDTDHYMPGAVLPKVDRMSMQHSLEVRTPFLNVELAKFAETVPPHLLVGGDKGKLLLKEIAYRYLPREMIDLPKKGFGLPMAARWGKAEMMGSLTKVLGADNKLGNWMGRENVRRFLAAQGTESGFSIYQAWGVTMLAHWLESRPAQLPARETVRACPYVPGHGLQQPEGQRQVRYFEWLSPDTLLLSQTVQEAGPVSSIYEIMGWHQKASIDRMLNKIDAHGSHEAPVQASIGAFSIPESDADCPPDLALIRGLSNAGLQLAGVTIVLADPMAVTPFLVQRLRAMKAAGLIVRNIHDPEAERRHYNFRYFSLPRSIWNWAKLRSHTVFNWKLSDGVSRGKRYEVSLPLQTGMPTASPMPYVVFEELRQLPPISAPIKDIEAAGGGRYAIEQSTVHFSPLKGGRLRSRLKLGCYRLIKNSPDIEKYLPIVVHEQIKDPGHSVFLTALNRLVADTSLPNPASATGAPVSRVVLYTHGLTAGGAERQWCNLAIGLNEVGIEVTMVVDSLRGSSAHYLPLLQRANIKVIETETVSLEGSAHLIQSSPSAATLLDPTVSPVADKALRLALVLSAIRPDAVLAQLDTPNIVGGVAALLTKVPRIVLSFRNYNPSNFSYLNISWFLPAYRSLVQSGRIVLTGNSTAGNYDYAQWIDIDPNKIHLLQNSIEQDEFHTASPGAIEKLRQEFQLGHDEQILLGVFRLSEEKEPLTFFKVCQRVLAEVPKARVIMLGEGPMKSELEAAIVDAGLSDRIHLAGRRQDVSSFLSLAQVLLLTSRHEGTPNVVMEAQVIGLPVVGTRAGALPDLIENNTTGFLANIGDVEALAASCIRLLDDSSLSKRISENIVKAERGQTRRNKALRVLDILQLTNEERVHNAGEISVCGS